MNTALHAAATLIGQGEFAPSPRDAYHSFLAWGQGGQVVVEQPQRYCQLKPAQ